MKLTKKLLQKITILTIILNILSISVLATETKEIQPKPDVLSKAHILIDQNTGNILMQNNIDTKVYPASTTKILTAIIVLENAELTDMVTVTKEAFEGLVAGSSSAGLKSGEIMSVSDMLYCLMLPSANEAANALAIHVSGSTEAFANAMTLKAVQLGAYNSNFENAHGLHNDNHYTTARDMSIIAKYAMKNETFSEIVNTAQKSVGPTNINDEAKIVYTSNMLIFRKSDSRYYEYTNGIKTGFTTPAGACLVSQATKGDMDLISIIYGGEKIASTGENTVFVDTKEMFEWGFNNHYSEDLLDTLKPLFEVPVKLSSESDYISLKAEHDLQGLVPIDFDKEKLTLTPDIPESINAPIKEGQEIGTVSVIYDGISYGTVDLLAVNEVEMSKVLYYVDILENFFNSDIFKMVLILLVGILVFSVFVTRARNKKRKIRRRKQKIKRRY